MKMILLGPLCVLLCVGMGAASSATDEPLQAIYDNNLNALKQYLQRGGDANVRNGRDNSLLMYATAYGTLNSMRLLLAHGANPNLKNAFDATALMWSVSDAAKLNLLLAKDADVNARTKSGRTPLLLAAMHADAGHSVEILASHGADPAATDGFGMNLIYAGA